MPWLDPGVVGALAACGVQVREAELCCSWDDYKKAEPGSVGATVQAHTTTQVLEYENAVLAREAEAKAKAAEAAAAAPPALVSTLKVSGPFTASVQFEGGREGYVFKQGEQGLGYYIDSVGRELKEKAAAQIQAKIAREKARQVLYHGVKVEPTE